MNDYKRLVFFGMLFLVLGNLAIRYLHPTPYFGDGLVGGVQGMLMGIAIGLNLWAVKVKRRQMRCGN